MSYMQGNAEKETPRGQSVGFKHWCLGICEEQWIFFFYMRLLMEALVLKSWKETGTNRNIMYCIKIADLSIPSRECHMTV
jgi:hypothetical protein